MIIRVDLPALLRKLAGVNKEVLLEIDGPATQGALVDALEERFAMLRGTVRDYATGDRRAYLRFFACGEDISHAGLAAPLPEMVMRGEQPFLIVGAVAGG